MTPANSIPTIVRAQYPSKTWWLENGRLVKTADGLPAIMQAMQKLFATERYAHAIYTGNYGVELESLIGKPKPYVMAILEQRLKEAIMQDDRINDVRMVRVDDGTDFIAYEVQVETKLGRFNLQSTIGV